MARRPVKGMGSFVHYSVPGHVIGGSEPGSWKASKRAKKQARIQANKGKTRPIATGGEISAKRTSECPWCGRPIAKRARIVPVRLTRANRKSWVHTECSTLRPNTAKQTERVPRSQPQEVTDGAQKSGGPQTHPVATGKGMAALRNSDCPWCGRPIFKGTRIVPVRMAEANKSSWIHAGCSIPSSTSQNNGGKQKRASKNTRKSQARTPRQPNYNEEPRSWEHRLQVPNDLEIHKAIGPTQRYDEDT